MLRPEIFTRATDWPSPASAHPNWEGVPPPKKIKSWKFKIYLKIQRVSPYNFRANGSILTKLFPDDVPRVRGRQLYCALASVGQSVSHVKIWGAAPPPQGSKYSLPKNVRLGGSILFGFAILWAVSGIFAIKVESCQKSRRILDVFFRPPKF